MVGRRIIKQIGKQNRRYALNVIETAGENGSIVLDYQHEKNTHSDNQFLQKKLEAEPMHEEIVTVVVDGAYVGGHNQGCKRKKYRVG